MPKREIIPPLFEGGVPLLNNIQSPAGWDAFYTVDNATAQNLSRAMNRGLQVSFIYDGKTRIVEGHAIGRSTKDGSLVYRAMQVAGEASRPLPQWTLFSIDKIEALTLLFTDSLAPRDGYSPGDKQMNPVLVELIP